MAAIDFETKLFTAGQTTVMHLPPSASAQLPSRGMVLVEGSINGARFLTALEPDGKGSHWLNMNENLRKAAHAQSGNTVSVSLEPSRDWPEPDIPADLEKALTDD